MVEEVAPLRCCFSGRVAVKRSLHSDIERVLDAFQAGLPCRFSTYRAGVCIADTIPHSVLQELWQYQMDM
eukprot:12868568-Heterocapsa_arctica.AAC.1